MQIDAEKARRICAEVCMKYAGTKYTSYKDYKVRWDDIYDSEITLVEALMNVFVTEEKYVPAGTYRGAKYILHYAEEVQHGGSISPREMKTVKRLAIEIKKAESIACCYQVEDGTERIAESLSFKGVDGKFWLKRIEEPSQLGIDGGRIIQLYTKHSGSGGFSARFDNGVWDMPPVTAFEREFIQNIVDAYND